MKKPFKRSYNFLFIKNNGWHATCYDFASWNPFFSIMKNLDQITETAALQSGDADIKLVSITRIK